jgi:hypothetical protein
MSYGDVSYECADTILTDDDEAAPDPLTTAQAMFPPSKAHHPSRMDTHAT